MNEPLEFAQGRAFFTPHRAAAQIAKIARQSPNLRIEVCEDRCFALDKWLDLGTIQYELPTSEESEKFPLADALRNGQFVWVTPTEEALKASLEEAIPDLKDYKEKAFKVMYEGLQDVARRLGLLLPCFSFDTIQEWPLKSHATWVMDVSALLQGCADFACQFLFPFVRLVIPPVANLEIQNQCDGFLARWRAKLDKEGKRVELLGYHIKSQAAQRTLMRLEWHHQIQVERVAIGNDRLRNIFDQDRDSEFKNAVTGLTNVQRSFADRLIFETAKEHRTHLGHGPSVRIATSDSGMARMALSEGMSPVFFHARIGNNPLGRLLSGTLSHPFTSEIYTVSLVELLWELATCFGSARLRTEDSSGEFCALAMSEMAWSPAHIKENIFACRWIIPEPDQLPETGNNLALPTVPAQPIVEVSTPTVIAQPIVEVSTEEVPSITPPQTANTVSSTSRFKIGVDKLFELAQMVVQEQSFSQKLIEDRTQTKTSVLREYRGFLISGGLLEYEDGNWKSTPALVGMVNAYHAADRFRLWQSLERVPALQVFVQYAQNQGRRPDWREAYSVQRGVAGLRSLAEVCGVVMVIPGQGLCATLAHPTVQEFAVSAVAHYNKLCRGNDWVETGAWLESLAWNEGIAPALARDLLESAAQANLLERFYEGSTPDTQFDDHNVLVLEIVEGEAVLKRYYIYRGDFLRSVRSSVRLSLAGGTP